MHIIPTLLTQAPDTFLSQHNSLKKFYHRFQIDVADNTLVPNTTLQIEDIQTLVNTETTQYDFHLMVRDYSVHIQKLASAQYKVGVIFIHASLQPNLTSLTALYPHLTFGLVFDLTDNVNTILSIYKDENLKHFQIMTITSGFQGSEFNQESLQKIEQLRSTNYKSQIYIDGGVNDKTIPLILNRKEKPDFLCIGSYLVTAENLEERVKELEKITYSMV